MPATVACDTSPFLRQELRLNWREVPILVNSFNRLDCLRRLIDWLVSARYRRIYVIDNASTYQPLPAYLAEIERLGLATIVRLEENAGHLAIWQQRLLERLGIESEYVYTDPDVVPAACCPADIVGHLQGVLADNPTIAVAGMGLRLDDLPDSYRFKAQVIGWERQFWLAPASVGLFHSPIDTTFALYRPGSGHCLGRPAIRTGWPYIAAHTSWYANRDAPTEEELFYAQTAAPGTSHWSIPKLPSHLEQAVRRQMAASPRVIGVAPRGLMPPGYFALDDLDPNAAPADGAYVVDCLKRLEAEPILGWRLLQAIKEQGRLVVHEREASAAQAAAILRGEPKWLTGWRLRRMITNARGWAGLASAASPAAAPTGPLMLHLEPGAIAADGMKPVEVEADAIDHWSGFAVV